MLLLVKDNRLDVNSAHTPELCRGKYTLVPIPASQAGYVDVPPRLAMPSLNDPGRASCVSASSTLNGALLHSLHVGAAVMDWLGYHPCI